MISKQHIEVFTGWQNDWNKFARDVLRVTLDKEQQNILSAVQHKKKVSVASGTSRGKDFVSAVAALCFLYLTPFFNDKGELVGNTKVAMTAPTDRQVGNIMFPEISRLFNRAKVLPGRLTGYDVRTDFKEWFLTGFKADRHNHEAWSGFHAANVMFVVTEASGMAENIFNAIEGNLQGNSRLLIVFNPNVSTGYAARSQRVSGWSKFRLDSLESPNVKAKEIVIPGQVDYDWVADKVKDWCSLIRKEEFNEGKGDFEWEGQFYRPNDLFRVKVRGMFPEVSEDMLIPYQWVRLANERWLEFKKQGWKIQDPLKLGVDVAGMGRDSSCFCPRYGDFVDKLRLHQSAGKADHMYIAGIVANDLKPSQAEAYIDTIGEGAGVYSRLQELGYDRAYSCKFSETADGLTDVTGQFQFANMRAYLFWAVRDWLNPVNDSKAMLPPDDVLTEEATEIRWKFQSNGKIIIEPKADIAKRLTRSTDSFDSLANTFYPHTNKQNQGMSAVELAGMLP